MRVTRRTLQAAQQHVSDLSPTQPTKRPKVDVENTISATKPKEKTKTKKNQTVFEEHTKKDEIETCGNHLSPMLKPKFSCDLFIGAHVSIEGGLSNAFANAEAIGAKAFAIFLRSQRQWVGKPLTQDAVDTFKETMKESGIASEFIVPHGIYLLNCGSPKEEVLSKSRTVLIDEHQRCDRLGLSLYNFHPGSTCGEIPRDESIRKIAGSINMAHKQSQRVVTLLENMCKQGNSIGGDFGELAAIINLVEDKSRIGICLDTCHAFAAGWDLSTAQGYETMMAEIERTVGLERVRALHLNDSKGVCGSHLDRHEDLGKGHIGWAGFERIVNDPRLRGRPMVLETPGHQSYDTQIKALLKKREKM